MEIAKPSITRIARRAGIKSMSEDCFPLIRSLIVLKLSFLLEKVLIINSEHGTKTILPTDIYDTLSVLGENLTQSTELGTTTLAGK